MDDSGREGAERSCSRLSERIVTVGGGSGSYIMLSDLQVGRRPALGGRRDDRQRRLLAPADVRDRPFVAAGRPAAGPGGAFSLYPTVG